MDQSPPADSILRQICNARPKDKLAKRHCLEIEAHLPSLVAQGQLSSTLVTVIPDITRTIEQSWLVVRTERDSVLTIIRDLPGMYFAVLALEVHGGPRPKKRQAPPNATAEPEAEEIPLENEDDPAQITTGSAEPATGAGTTLKGLKGHPHLHLLIYYPRSTIPALDPSYVKRLLLERFPKGDVNQVHQRTKTSDDARKKIVGAMTYILKGIGCPVMTAAWARVHPSHPTPIPTAVLGALYVRGSTPGMRLMEMLRVLTGTLTTGEPLDEADAPAHFQGAPQVCKETASMLLVAQAVNQLGYRIRGDKSWYKLQADTQHTWVQFTDNDGLIHMLSANDSFVDICVRYLSKMPLWFKMASFKRLPSDTTFRFIELQDCCYEIRTGLYFDKSSFTGSCFRYYDISKQQSLDCQPTEWLKLIHNQYLLPSEREKEKPFLMKMARMLRPRRPKEPILFIVGVPNSGKSTAIKWLTLLYPDQAIGTINDSVAPLSLVKGKEVLICDEFATHKISRSNLLLLTDGATGLTVRELGQAAEFISNITLPQVFTCNTGCEPHYKNDPQPDAVDVRFDYYRWERPIRRPDWDAADKIAEETPYIVFYLNRLLQST